MPPAQPTLDSNDLALAEDVCDEAWRLLEAVVADLSPHDGIAIRHGIANRVKAAMLDGERDTEKLKTIALNLHLGGDNGGS